MKELEKLLKENSGLLSRMKERDGNEKLNKICEEKEIAEYEKEMRHAPSYLATVGKERRK